MAEWRYLGILEEHIDDGVLREELETEMVDAYGGTGKFPTSYYTGWFHTLGLIEKEQVGRKTKFRLLIPSRG